MSGEKQVKIAGRRTRKPKTAAVQTQTEEEKLLDLPLVEAPIAQPPEAERINAGVPEPQAQVTPAEETEIRKEADTRAVQRKRRREVADKVDMVSTVPDLNSYIEHMKDTNGRVMRLAEKMAERLFSDLPLQNAKIAKPPDLFIPQQPVPTESPGSDPYAMQYRREMEERMRRTAPPPQTEWELPPPNRAAMQSGGGVLPNFGSQRFKPNPVHRRAEVGHPEVYPVIPPPGHSFYW